MANESILDTIIPSYNVKELPSHSVGKLHYSDGSDLEAGQLSSPWQTVLSSSAHIKVDLSKGQYVRHTLTENTTVDDPTGAPADGTLVVFKFLNTTDNRTVAWGNKFKWVAGSGPTVTTGAKTSLVMFMYDATDDLYYECGRFLNM